MKKFDVTKTQMIKSGKALRLEFHADLKEDNPSALEKVFHTSTTQLLEMKKELKKAEIDLIESLSQQTRKEWMDVAYKLQQIEYARQYQKLWIANFEMLTTSNQWIDTDNEACISNSLYMMKVSLQADSVSGYKVDWSLMIRRINPEATGIDMVGIDGQHGKKFATKGEAVKYIEGRYNKYRELFAADTLEVPAEYADGLKYMGVFLPGYRVASQKSGN